MNNKNYMLGWCLLTFIAAFANTAAANQQPLFKQGDVSPADAARAETLYEKHCSGCHSGGVPKAPRRDMLQTMASRSIYKALTDGMMRVQAQVLSEPDKQLVADYIGAGSVADVSASAPPMCKAGAAEFDLSKPPAAVGWGYDPRRFVASEQAGLSKQQLPQLTLKWSFAFPDATRARSQPVLAMGAIFVGSQDGSIYAFDLESGCLRWQQNVGAEVRTAIVVEPWSKGAPIKHTPRLFFGDLLGRVYALNALTGELLWRQVADDHASATITGTPLLVGDTLYVPVSSLESATAANPDFACCTFRGSLLALNIDTGAPRWRHYTVRQKAQLQGQNTRGVDVYGPSGGAVWTSPSYDEKRNIVYHGSGQNYSEPADTNSDAVFAVDATSGKRLWSQQFSANDIWTPICIIVPGSCVSDQPLDSDIAASVLLLDDGAGREVLVAGQKSGWVYGLDPDQRGKILWRQRLGRGGLFGGVHFGMAAQGLRLYVPIADTPHYWDGSEPPGQASPGLYGLDARTGKVLWQQRASADKCRDGTFCNPGISAAITAIDGAVIAGHLDGMVRAYDADTGAILWQDDTTKEHIGVNGLVVRGGSMSGPGAAVGDGYVVLNSGYGFAAHEPGNALLVYSVGVK